MITYTYRPITAEEKQKITFKPGVFKSIEDFILVLFGIVLALDIPLLIYDHFSPVASHIQAIYCIAMVGIALLLTIMIMRKVARSRRRKNATIPDRVEVIQVKTTRALRRKDFEDFGVAFYIDVTDQGQPKALFLWGQYLDELEGESFPNTEFEIVRLPNAQEFLDFKVTGHYFKEQRSLPAFDKEIWQSGVYPVNGQLIDRNIDTIIE